MKKLFLFTITVFILSQIGCQLDCSTVLPYWNINNIKNVELRAASSPYNEITGAVYSGEKLELRCILGVDFIAQSNFSINNPFARTAIAQFTGIGGSSKPRCSDPGYEGVKDSITNVTVTSSEDFGGIPAGNPINPFVKVNYSYPIETALELNYLSFSHLSNSNEPIVHSYRIEYAALTKFNHSFTIKYQTESGATFSYTTPMITWQR